MPELESIQMGWGALMFNSWSDDSELIMLSDEMNVN